MVAQKTETNQRMMDHKSKFIAAFSPEFDVIAMTT